MIDLPNKKLLRPDEVAAFWRVSVSTIYRWIDLGIMDGTRRGGTIRVEREEAKKSEKGGIGTAGLVGHGAAGPGAAGRGVVRNGMAGEARSGKARLGSVRFGRKGKDI